MGDDPQRAIEAGGLPFAVDRQHRAHDAVRGQLRENLLEFLDTWPHADTNPKDATREARRGDRAILPHLRRSYIGVPLNRGLYPRL